MISAALNTERELKLVPPPSVATPIEWKSLETLITTFLHTGLYHYKGRRPKLSQFFQGALTSSKVLGDVFPIHDTVSLLTDDRVYGVTLPTNLPVNETIVSQCMETNDLIDARIHINETVFMLQYRGCKKRSSSGCHQKFTKWMTKMNANCNQPGYYIYLTTKVLEPSARNTVIAELENQSVTDSNGKRKVFMLISRNELTTFFPPFIARLLIDWDYSNEYPYASFNLNQLRTEYKKCVGPPSNVSIRLL